MVRKISMAEKVIREVAEYILAFLVIIECNSLFNNSVDNYSASLGDVSLYVSIGILAGLICYYFIRSAKMRHDFPHFVPVLVLVEVCAAAFYVLNVSRYMPANSTDYICRFLLFLPLATLYFWCKRKVGQEYDLFLKMADLVCVYALLNLVTYVTVVLRPDSVYAELVSTRWSYIGEVRRPAEYYNLMATEFLSFQIAGHSVALPRNLGIYPETPMYALILVVTLYTEMYLRQRKFRQPLRWAVLTLALVSSQGILGMMLVVLAWGIKSLETVGRKTKGILRVLLMIFVLLMMAGSVHLLYHYKSYLGEWEFSSFNVHLEDFRVGLQAFLHKPLLGGGYDNSAYLQNFMSESRRAYNSGFSNTVTAVLGEGGIVLGVFCMLPYLIGLLNVFTKRNKETAAWALGMFGCYCVIIFNFRMLLLVMMAFGYSCVYFRHGVKLYDTPCAEEKPLIRWNWLFLVIAGGLSFLMIFYGQPVWSALRLFLLRYQLYIGQSAPRLACFLLLLITTAVVFRECMRRKKVSNRLRGVAGLAACLLLYGLLYTRLRELVNVQLVLKGSWSEGGESILLYLIFLIILAVCLLLGSLRPEALRHHPVPAIVIPAACLGVFFWFFRTLPDYYLRCVDMRVASDMKCISLVSAVPSANLYADEEPRLYRAMVPSLKYSATTGNGHVGDTAATVIMARESNCRDLFNAGWLMTPVSDYSVLYTNQPEVITALQEQGYTFYSHDPLTRDVDWTNADLDHSTLDAGTYTVAFHLHMDTAQVLTDGSNDPQIGTVSVSAFYYGARQGAASSDVTYSDFDENGNAVASVTFTVPDCMQVGYYFDAASGITCNVQEATICETPDHDTRRVYNGRRQVLLESYYDGNGLPVTLADGYGQILYGYDRDMNNISITYLDVNGTPVNNTNGYAQVQRTFDSLNRCIQESYFASDGNPVVASNTGFAAIVRTYDADGYEIRESYYGTDGNLLANGDGVAQWSRTYDENGNTLSILYDGADGEPVITPWGYAEIHYTYDAENHETSESYYDVDGQPVTLDNGTAGLVQDEFDDNGNAQIVYYVDTAGEKSARNDGIAEFHRRYDENNRIIYEAYFDAGGAPFAVDGGYCAVSWEYDDAGNVTAQKYYDGSGSPVITDWGYAEIHWTYNDRNQKITESYYDTSGNPMALPSGQASDTRVYDDAGNLIDRKFYDLSGNPVMTTDGYAEVQYTYDENNQVTSETHLDTMGNVVG